MWNYRWLVIYFLINRRLSSTDCSSGARKVRYKEWTTGSQNKENQSNGVAVSARKWNYDKRLDGCTATLIDENVYLQSISSTYPKESFPSERLSKLIRLGKASYSIYGGEIFSQFHNVCVSNRGSSVHQRDEISLHSIYWNRYRWTFAGFSIRLTLHHKCRVPIVRVDLRIKLRSCRRVPFPLHSEMFAVHCT